MCDPGHAADLVRTIVEAVPIPVTVKMRLGWELTCSPSQLETQEAGLLIGSL